MTKYLSLLICTVVISGCASVDLRDKYNPNGGTLYDHFHWGNYETVLQKANNYCNTFGKGHANITRVSEGCLLVCKMEYHVYDFVCSNDDNKPKDSPTSVEKITATSQQKVQDISITKITLDKAKTKCTDLGFKPKTEKFGNCVMELTK